MDGFPSAHMPKRPDADPVIARVALPVLFAWLAEAAAVPAPIPVFEPADVTDDVAPQRARLIAKPAEITAQAAVSLSFAAVPSASPAPSPVPEAPPAPTRYQISAQFSLAPTLAVPEPAPMAQTAPLAPTAAERETVSPPPFLPPPLIAPVLRPRPLHSRADDFLPGRNKG